MTKKILPLFLVMILLTMGFMSVPGTPDEVEDDGIAEWTFMVYMAAGNDLEPAGIHDMDQMELVGSDENVNIVVLFDRVDGYSTAEGDWTGTRIYHVQHNSNYGSLGEYEEGVNVWNSIDEVDLNMGDPETLVNFTLWTVENFPAKKYATVLWNHGAGFWGICWDDAYEDRLMMPDLRSAFDNITRSMGRRLDLIGFDACLMAHASVMYEIKDYADIGVASGLVEPWDGWPYDRILRPLADNPQMDARELGKIIVDEYVESYTNQEDDPDDSMMATMAAFDLAAFENAAEAINQFGMAMSVGPDFALRGSTTYYGQLRRIRSVTRSYDLVKAGPFNYHYTFYDMIDFADRVGRNPSLSFLHESAYNMMTAIEEATYYSNANDFRVKHHGLGVYFPSGTQTTYTDLFDTTRFAQEKYWDTFLHNFASHTLVDDTPPSVTITYPRGAESIPVEDGTVTISGTAFDLQNNLISVEIRIGEDGEWITVDGRETWKYVMPVAGQSGVHTVYARSFDGNEYSPEVERTFLVAEPVVSSVPAERDVRAPWLIIAAVLIAVAVVVSMKKGLLDKVTRSMTKP